jgi:hypothetical protein
MHYFLIAAYGHTYKTVYDLMRGFALGRDFYPQNVVPNGFLGNLSVVELLSDKDWTGMTVMYGSDNNKSVTWTRDEFLTYLTKAEEDLAAEVHSSLFA